MGGCSTTIITAIRLRIGFWVLTKTEWPPAAGSISSLLEANPGSSCIESRRACSTPWADESICTRAGKNSTRRCRSCSSGSKRIAMQYSPENNIPYIGLVDAGTVELIRKLKKKVVSSADLVQKFEASWSPEQLESHLEAGQDHRSHPRRARSSRQLPVVSGQSRSPNLNCSNGYSSSSAPTG